MNFDNGSSEFETTPHVMLGAVPPPNLTLLTIPEQIAAQLAREIVDGLFQVDEKLSEEKLASRFGVSRGPIRDAIALLERNAFVRSKPRLSARVNAITHDDAQQLFEVRARLFGLQASYAARRATPPDVDLMREAVAALERHHKENPSDVGGFFTSSTRVWIIVDRVARARRISSVTANVAGSAIWHLAFRDRLHTAVNTLPGRTFLAHWKKMIDAIAEGDELGADQAAQNVVGTTWQMIEKAFAEGNTKARA